MKKHVNATIKDEDLLQKLSELSSSDKELVTQLIERLRKEE